MKDRNGMKCLFFKTIKTVGNVKINDNCFRSLTTFLTRALLGGGVFERPPPLRFIEDSENTAACSAAGFSPTWLIFSTTFVKMST